MRAGSPSWWVGKVRQARRHVLARVTPGERDDLATWLTPPQLALFDTMHVADRRHGLDVAAWLRANGEQDAEVLVAGLLHDAGKGSVGLIPRVVHSLALAYAPGMTTAFSGLPRLARDLAILATHADTSAGLAAAAGCSPRTVELIRQQEVEPAPDEASRRLHLADEAS
jgi:hypothetical protein